MMDAREAHIYFSKTCFNDAWDLIEKEGKTQEDIHAMIHLAHTSLFHWLRRADCTDQNLSVGYWQLSRVYALAGMGEPALHFANVCLQFSQQHGVAPLFLGYAYEALARAYQVRNDPARMKINMDLASDIAMALPDGDRDQLLADLDGLK